VHRVHSSTSAGGVRASRSQPGAGASGAESATQGAERKQDSKESAARLAVSDVDIPAARMVGVGALEFEPLEERRPPTPTAATCTCREDHPRARAEARGEHPGQAAADASPTRSELRRLAVEAHPVSSGGAMGISGANATREGVKTMPIWAWVLIIVLVIALLGGFGYSRR
jgi:hypothetical protein